MASLLRTSLKLAVLAIAASTAAQVPAAPRPLNTSICDWYTTALFKDNNATNQAKLITALVNTAVIGNYSVSPVPVPGILAQGQKYNGTDVNLLPYFSGGLVSTDRMGKAVSVNFLDSGGAKPLMEGEPADSDGSAQYKLLTHLYQYFGMLLGCTSMNASYSGVMSMYNVHKYVNLTYHNPALTWTTANNLPQMALDAYEVGYFIEQVALAGASFGVSEKDLQYVGQTLGKLFGEKCTPAIDIVPGKDAELQSICVAQNCPQAANSTCKAYGTVVEPARANGSATSTATPSSTKASGAGRTTITSLTGLLMLVGIMCWVLGA